MYYALVIDGTIQATYNGLPPNGRRLDTGEWVEATNGVWDPDNLAACGYVQVVDTPRPADTPTETYDFSVQMVDDGTGTGTLVPTVVWVARPKTQEEINAANAAQMKADLKAAITSLIDLRASIKLNILDVANTTINGSPAGYIKDAARAIRQTDRELIRVCRLLSDTLDSTDTGAI